MSSHDPQQAGKISPAAQSSSSGPADANKMPNQYPYRSLATKSTVRLVKLEKLKVEDRIACSIRYAEQSTAEYDALSYVWGDGTPTRDIVICDDEAHEWNFRIHENLWQFLDHAWEREIFDRWLWTDRICLNQEDKTEIEEQIPRMADIYHNAVRVIAWLGLSTSQGEHLIPVRDFIQTNPNLFADVWVTEFSEESKLAARSAFSAEYWERVWVVQEVVSAKDIVFFIGNMDMTFGEVRQLILYADIATKPRSVRRCEFLAGTRGYARPSLGCHTPKVDLEHLLSLVTSKNFKSHKPHDLVYGILGLVADLSDGTSPLEHIGVDYDKPPADVLLDAILESYETWTCYTSYLTVINLLLERPDNTKSQEPIFTFLTRYTESSLTSQRHRNLAKLVLSVSDALYFIASTSGFPPGNWSTYRAFCKLIPTPHPAFFDKRVKYTPQSSALMLGVALAFAKFDSEMDQMAENWESCRRPRVEANSPWRCAAHQSVCSKLSVQHIDEPGPGCKI